MIKSIIFDFDGVIVDSVDIKTNAFVDIYNSETNIIKEKIKDYHLQNLGISRYDKICFFERNFLKKNLIKNDIEIKLDKFAVEVQTRVKNSNFIDGALEFLKNYNKNYNLFISSATPETELRNIILHKKINKYFLDIYGSPKNKAQHINKIIKNYDLDKKEILFVGDSRNDFFSAKKCDLKFVGLINKYEKFNQFKYRIKNIFDLVDIISLINKN